jgi:predicted nucleic acid-binding protein
MMVVLDTSVIIDAARRKKYALELLESYLGKEQIAQQLSQDMNYSG